MKILGIAGSPRKNGNSTLLLKEALRSAEQEGAETELILLREKDITPCDGCWTCFKTYKCHIKDDMQEIYQKLEAADGLIIGSPTHISSVSSICQAFLERSRCLIRMKEEDEVFVHSDKVSLLMGKPGGSIVTGRRRGVQTALEVLNFFLLMHRMVLTHAGVAGFCQSTKPGAIKDEDKYAVEMAAELGRAVVTYARKLTADRTGSVLEKA
ncbi:MAG: flavodoxin family protein [Chloroflexi bacterium]|nr:flavodoxin family protein [Chloroflexota bacterium]